jgi:hypothetical protein
MSSVSCSLASKVNSTFSEFGVGVDDSSFLTANADVLKERKKERKRLGK